VAEWQPIETAPKDGTRLLLFGTERVFLTDRAFVGRWDAERAGGSWVGPEWRCIPTHWMPLPEPPSAVPSVEAHSAGVLVRGEEG
jgi:hypothetical protein